MMRGFKIAGAWVAVIAVFVGWSYWSELPKYKFERDAAKMGSLPGMRVISTFKTLSIASPISWFSPPTTTWNFATPDPLMLDRFYTITLIYGEKESPIVFLADVECHAPPKATLYDLDEPDNALPARDLWGEPVTAPNGKTYRRRPETKIPFPLEHLRAFCETDWTNERHAMTQTRR